MNARGESLSLILKFYIPLAAQFLTLLHRYNQVLDIKWG